MKTRLFLTGIALIMATVISNAQNSGCKGKENCKGKQGSGYVDKNKNGVCDKAESKSDKSSVNKQGKQNQNKGKNFVDKNNNGTCDNKEAKAVK
jgi:hypothetical protein